MVEWEVRVRGRFRPEMVEKRVGDDGGEGLEVDVRMW